MFRKKAKRRNKCVCCGCFVSGGGNSHKLGTCPPERNSSTRNANKRRRRREKMIPRIQRGVSVSGIHKKSASSKSA